MIDSNVNIPTFLFDDLPFHWQMTRCEKYAFSAILRAVQPDVAIEVGTYKGGSLQVIAHFAKKVYSIDKSARYKELLSDNFSNVEFITGYSAEILPILLEKIGNEKETLEFILIDGDHSTDGVKNDINICLKYTPTEPLYIIFHDSFHPRSRRGLLDASWHECEYVHYVEIDFIPGVYHHEAFDKAKPHSMYGGFALALMLPEKRSDDLVIHQSQKGLYDIVFPHSYHCRENKISIKKLLSRLKKELVNTNIRIR
jgi:hypothetical protein